MLMSRSVVASLLVVLSAVAAQASWSHRYEALKNTQHSAIAALPNGGFVVVAQGTPTGIIVIDAQGSVKASRQVDGLEIRFVTTTPGGDIYVIARPSIDGTSCLLKLHPDLSLMWARRVADLDDHPIGLIRAAGTVDGGVVVAGHVDASMVVVRLDARGNVRWATRVDPSGNDVIEAIAETHDGGCIAGGVSPHFPWLVRLAADGSLLWQRGYGPWLGGQFQAVIESRGGDLFAVGRDQTAMVVKLNRQGDVLWSRAATVPSEGHSVVETTTGVIVTLTGQAGDILQMIAIRENGTVQWKKQFEPGNHALYWYEYENAMIAMSGNQIGLTVGSAKELAVFSADPSTGPAGCALFSDGTVSLMEHTIREETVIAEHSSPRLKTDDVDVSFSALEVHDTTASCVAPAVIVPQRMRTVPPAPTLAFRLPTDWNANAGRLIDHLKGRRFAELEAMAVEARNYVSPEPTRPNRAIHAFYNAFNDNEAASLQTRLTLLRAWVAEHPRSNTARIALATALYNAAWLARGNGFSDTVTTTGGGTYETLMSEMQDVLDCVSGEAKADPHYWVLIINLTHELGLGDVTEVGLRALTLHPDPQIAEAVKRYLAAQWGGSPETYMKFADDAARVTASKYGDVMFMWMVFRVEITDTAEDYKTYGVYWKRVKKGAEDLIRMQPDWPPSYHRFARLAHLYGDEDAVRSLFQRPELGWYEGADKIWSHRLEYDSVREDALESR